MKKITADLRGLSGDVQLVPLADLHMGDPLSRAKLINQWIERIRTTDGMYCVLAGDLMDTATKTSIGDTYSAVLTPMEQLAQCVKIFQPLADAGKILAVVGGNHEERISKTEGVDMTQILCNQLGIGDLYSPTSALLLIKTAASQIAGHRNSSVTYSVYINHGNGGGKRPGSKINALQDYALIVDADIYIVGHTHLPAAFKMSYFRLTGGNARLIQAEKTFVNTASALAYGGYGDRKGFAPASNSYPVIRLKELTQTQVEKFRKDSTNDIRKVEVTF